jgi:hypothetical protein
LPVTFTTRVEEDLAKLMDEVSKDEFSVKLFFAFYH